MSSTATVLHFSLAQSAGTNTVGARELRCCTEFHEFPINPQASKRNISADQSIETHCTGQQTALNIGVSCITTPKKSATKWVANINPLTGDTHTPLRIMIMRYILVYTLLRVN